MTFTVADFRDLVRLLTLHPEWRVELSHLLLDEALLKLPQIVQELAEAQQRTEAALQQLAEAQQRTEQRLEELAKAQQRTEEQLAQLSARVDALAEAQRDTDRRLQELAEAQRNTDRRLQELAEAQRDTDRRLQELAEQTDRRFRELAEAQRNTMILLGQLQTAFGATVEEEAESVLQWILEEKGYRVLGEPYSLALDGEIDVIMEVEDPTGARVWAVVEAKARLSHRQVRKWGQRMRSTGWRQRLHASGVPGPYLVYAFGIRVDPGAVRAAEEQGIGLLTGRGERVSPKELIQAFGPDSDPTVSHGNPEGRR